MEKIFSSGEMGVPDPEKEVNQGRVELQPDTRPNPEASLEEFQEMIDQLPILRKMLREAEEELLALMKSPDTDKSLIEEAKVQIENLKEEISNREDLIS